MKFSLQAFFFLLFFFLFFFVVVRKSALTGQTIVLVTQDSPFIPGGCSISTPAENGGAPLLPVSRVWNFAPGPANDDFTYAIFGTPPTPPRAPFPPHTHTKC